MQDYQDHGPVLPGNGPAPGDEVGTAAWNEPGIVGKVLDGGAYGVICPMVNTREEAKAEAILSSP